MSRHPRRMASTSAAAVLAVAIGFAGSSALSAQAADKDAAVTKAQVKKLAKKEATKQILALAPTLSVASAKTATSATSATTAQSAQTAQSAVAAQTAITAQTAAAATRLTSAEVRTFGTTVANGGAGVVLGTIAGLTLTATCPGSSPTITASGSPTGGKLRFSYFNGDDLTSSSDGTSNLTTYGLTPASGLGSGSANYRSTTNQAVTAGYGWRTEGTSCLFFGSMLGG